MHSRKDEFTLECQNVGTLKYIRIGHDNKGGAAGWYLEKVEVVDLSNGQIYQFPCNRWLAVDEDDGAIERDLVPGGSVYHFILIDVHFSSYVRKFTRFNL